jgi:hypothetical protein
MAIHSFMTRILIEGEDHNWQEHLLRQVVEEHGYDVDVLLVYGDGGFHIGFNKDKVYPEDHVQVPIVMDILNDIVKTSKEFHEADWSLFNRSLPMYEKVFTTFKAYHKFNLMIDQWKNEDSYIRM